MINDLPSAHHCTFMYRHDYTCSTTEWLANIPNACCEWYISLIMAGNSQFIEYQNSNILEFNCMWLQSSINNNNFDRFTVDINRPIMYIHVAPNSVSDLFILWIFKKGSIIIDSVCTWSTIFHKTSKLGIRMRIHPLSSSKVQLKVFWKWQITCFCYWYKMYCWFDRVINLEMSIESI